MGSETIGFIGLGIMGMPMMNHLLSAGHKLVVYNRSKEPIESAVALGAQGGESCRDVAVRTQVVISMVPDSPDVEKVFLSEDGVLAGARPDTLLVDMSTISPVTAIKVAQAAKEKECPMLDAPVSGGEVGA
ncbi:MAG: NAD(P)-binding domain-containing protein, partial [Anaerolineales bacterium]|nr:NAD(P)-binding domain-containing protein [Anaerolineales bacterium]